MDCHHFRAESCRSCTWLPLPYAEQVAAKQDRCASALAGYPQLHWLKPVTGPESGFRNKAKMVVSGTVDQPLLGILGPDGGVDLRDCGLHIPAVADSLPVLAQFITRAALRPYDVATRRGELKYVLVTGSPAGELMVRFVCRSREPVSRIRKHLDWLTSELAGLVVVTVNLQPEHKAILEGPDELVLSATQELAMQVNEIELSLRPQSFFQTNTNIAAALYRTAREWASEFAPRSVWDLYCGVGGFALHLAAPGVDVVGQELSEEAVASARSTAARLGIEVRFESGDALAAEELGEVPDLVVVNPPRRGLGLELAGWVQASGVSRVLYSSCNPDTLATDLAAMPDLVPVRGQVFDMFPQTTHAEVLVLLERATSPA